MIDSDLAKHSFEAAGEILAKVWEEVALDKFPVVAKYLENSRNDSVEVDEKWVITHCRIFLQNVLILCCGNFDQHGS